MGLSLKIPAKLMPAVLAFMCFGAGAMSAFSMAPHNVWLLLFIGLSLLYAAIAQTQGKWSAFLYGYCFAFGYFLFSLSWIGNALLVEGNPYRWAWPLAVVGLPLILAPFFATGCLVARRYFDLGTLSGFLGFTACIATTEWLRGHLFTGFPWNLFGYTWGGTLEVAQVAALGNIYHLTALTILWASTIGFIFLQGPSKKDKIIIAALSILSLGLAYSFGSWRLQNNPTKYRDDVSIHLVQPNIDQAEKWQRDKMAAHFFKHIRLSYPDETADTEQDKTTFIVWPETALSYRFLQDKTSMGVLTQMLDSYQGAAYLLTGALLLDDAQYHNALIRINQDGELENRYSKHHLVPFGEYIPFQKWIPLKPVASFSGFSEGKKPKPEMIEESFSYLPLICYEVIFPGLARPDNQAPDFIVNVTNDAWYGFSAGPYQHLQQAVFRAIESGVPLIRSANTGVSAIIDPLGREVLKTDVFEDFSKAFPLPAKNMLFEKNTSLNIFSFFGLISFMLLGAALLRPHKNYQ